MEPLEVPIEDWICRFVKLNHWNHDGAYWRPDNVYGVCECWKDAHTQIESPAGNAGFPLTYRVLLAQNATCPRLPLTA